MGNVIELKRVYNPMDHTDCDHIQWQMVPGATVADLLDATGSVVSDRDGMGFAVSINGIPVPAEQRGVTRLQPGQFVTVIPYLYGGGGGKDVIRMIGMLALAIVAPELGVMMGGFFTGLTLGEFGLVGFYAAAGLTTFGVMVGGAALLNAILPPAKPQIPTGNSIAQSNSYSWSPVNRQQQGIAIPVYYGPCKVVGNIIGTFRQEVDGGSTQNLNVLVSGGMGPVAPFYDFKLNGQPLENFSSFNIATNLHTRLGELDQPVIDGFGETVLEYPLSTLVSYGTDCNYTTIGADFDALSITVGFPNGLYKFNASGGLDPLSINYSIEIRKQGDTTWTVLTHQPGTTKVSDGGYWSLGVEEAWNSSYSEETIADMGGLQYSYYEIAVGSSDPNDHYNGEYGNGGIWSWVGSPIRVVDVVLDYATATSASSSRTVYTWRQTGLEAGRYDIRIKRLTPDYTETTYGDEFYLLTVQEVVQDTFTYPGEALIALKPVADSQLSGSFSFECKTDGKLCRVYNGASWSIEPTSNPAWVCWDILTQPVIGGTRSTGYYVIEYAGYDPSQLDLDRFHEWAQYCDDLVPDGNGGTERRLTYSGGFDTAQNQWDAVLAVGKIGRATPYWRGKTITLAIDKPSSPVTLISVGNIGLDSFEETFLSMENRAGSIEADFLNSEKDFERDKLTVINPDAPSTWGSTSLPLQGVVKPSEVYRHCRYYLATTQHLIRVVTVQIDVDAIAFTLGDVINVQHDVPMWGEGGRLVAAGDSTVTLDKTVTIESGKSYAVMVRLLDGTLVTRSVVNAVGDYIQLDLATPFAEYPQQYDVYAFGEVDKVTKPMRVSGIDPAGDLKRKITLTDYNESVYNTDLLQPVLPTPDYSTSRDIPSVVGLTVTERMMKRLDGTIDNYLVVTFAPPVNRNRWMRADIQLSSPGVPFTKVSESLTGSEVLIPCRELVTYSVRAVSVDYVGNPRAVEQCPVESITTKGKTAKPANCSNVAVTIAKTGGTATWGGVTDVDLSLYLVRVGAIWDAAEEVARTPDTRAFLGYLSAGTHTVQVKALDSSELESEEAATCNVTIQAPAAPVVTAVISATDCVFSWQDCTTSYTVQTYEIRSGASFDAGEPVAVVSALSFKLPVTWTGSRTFWVRAVDAGLNKSVAGSVAVAVAAAEAPSVTAQLVGGDCKVSWTIPSASLPIDSYELRVGNSYATAASQGTIKGTAATIPVRWPSAIIWVAAIDANGTPGTPGSVSVNVALPGVSGLAADVIDNNVLLRWVGTAGSLVIKEYNIYKGATFATAVKKWSVSSTSSPLFESVGGQYTYWVEPVDAAGNAGVAVSVSVTVNQPPDYVLNVNWISNLTGAVTNMYKCPLTGWKALVKPAETWATHFSSNAKTTLRDFINAGFTKYLQPSATTAQYVESFDYGTILAGTKITVTLDHSPIVGTPSVQCTIQISPDNATWTTYNNVWEAYATSFRYVKITITWATATQAVDQVNGLSVRLDSKVKTDPGGIATITDANAGVWVPFTIPFVDVSNISITPLGSVPRNYILDFADAPYPAGFRLYLTDTSLNKVTGSFMWGASGY